MNPVILAIQGCIGFALAADGVYLLVRNRRRRRREAFVCALACVLAGIFLLGYVIYQAV